MSWLESLKKAFNIPELSGRRVRQLETEEKIDRRLSLECAQCGEDVLKYLFKMREVHRKNSIEIYRAPLYEYPEKYEKYMDEVDGMQTGILESNNLCSYLSKIHRVEIDRFKEKHK